MRVEGTFIPTSSLAWLHFHRRAPRYIQKYIKRFTILNSASFFFFIDVRTYFVNWMVYLLVRQSNFFLLLTKLQHSSLFYISRRGKRSKVTFPTTRIEKLSSSMTIPTNKFFIWKDNSIAEEKWFLPTFWNYTYLKLCFRDKLLQIIFEIDLSSSKRRIFMKRPYLDSFLSTKNRLRIKLEGYANKMNPSTNYNAEINLLNVNQQIIQTYHDDDYVRII